MPQRPTHLLRDYDSKFVPDFDAILQSEGVQVRKVGPRAPNMNAVAERFVQTVKSECLDHFVFFGEAHLRHVLTELERDYNEARPHQGIGNVPIAGPPLLAPADGPGHGEVVCEERLGGLLKHYRRSA